ncbi:hypothetical protein LIER_00149 [Lithospermum erythrorhizon]|uniref:Uncharacterized protein n=1 Tax=Lithospermum erythrorhizon TaxID=34254 RepID=A0AAV3NGV7_LITER
MEFDWDFGRKWWFWVEGGRRRRFREETTAKDAILTAEMVVVDTYLKEKKTDWGLVLDCFVNTIVPPPFTWKSSNPTNTKATAAVDFPHWSTTLPKEINPTKVNGLHSSYPFRYSFTSLLPNQQSRNNKLTCGVLLSLLWPCFGFLRTVVGNNFCESSSSSAVTSVLVLQ